MQFSHAKETMILSVKERILALRLLEKQNKHPEHAKKIGVKVKMKKNQKKKENIKKSVQNGDV